MEKLLTSKELAIELGRHLNYIYAMKRMGFLMPGGRATLAEARRFLVRNPPPRGNGGKRCNAGIVK